jgi:hypothetical protein
MNNMLDTLRSNESKFNGYVNYGIWKFKIDNILLDLRTLTYKIEP